MSPEVLLSKLETLTQVLDDLKIHVKQRREEQEKAHYEIERQVQLSVDTAIAVARRMLLLEGIVAPQTAREVFELLGKKKLIRSSMAKTLANAVGLRNLIVHEYGKIDYDLFFSGLPKGYSALVGFTQIARGFLKKNG